ncbi:hypothetical protein L3Y34_014978 [Caenorhabditis briggsae]|uniref:Uncharacterized protein n=1 Tax=Caenorhabditis briggsae TaxID=6238 RepID=A0AAE9DUP8_CAEBR|nr:hypothetical protein L3Y34_014978 [Caenorhabditis briggsae]
MSTKLLLLFLVLCATQLQTSVHGQKSRLPGLETNRGKPYHGVRQPERRMDEIPEYDREKGVFSRNKRAAPPTQPTKKAGNTTAGPVNRTHMALVEKRVKGFVTVYGGLTGALIFLCFANIGLFIWLSITLKKLKKP